ncbi:MAG: hypothetical protein ACRDM7_05350, partial [Thermoleophilaceae bacterium]
GERMHVNGQPTPETRGTSVSTIASHTPATPAWASQVAGANVQDPQRGLAVAGAGGTPIFLADSPEALERKFQAQIAANQAAWGSA